MKYIVEVAGEEIVLEVKEKAKNKIKVVQNNGIVEIEWTLCSQYPLVSLIIGEKPYCFFLMRKNGELYLASEGKPVKFEVSKGGERKRKIGDSRTGLLERITSPLSGLVASVFVSNGDRVKKGEPLLVLEAMKMRNEIRATRDGEIVEVKVKPGMSVELGTLLLTFKVA